MGFPYMAVPAHVAVRANGSLGGPLSGLEIFSYGFSLRQVPAEINDANRAAIAELVRVHFADVKSGVTGMGFLDDVTFANIGADGKQIGDTVRIAKSAQGNFNGALHPAQVSARISLGDGQRGRSHRGGWYMPYTGWALSTNGNSQQSDAANLLTSTLALIRGVNGVFGAAGTVSPSVVIAGQAGLMPVSVVRVGNILDTIRTRRNGLTETYSTGAV
jgi:hypothetical protein